MKIIKLLEGRRNPEKNPKTNIFSELVGMQVKLRADGDVLSNGFTNGFISFAELIKIGFNPSPKDHSTPAALYSYPLDYVISKMKGAQVDSPAESTIPYAADFPYLNVFSIKDKSKILFIDDSVNHGQTSGIPASSGTTSEPEFVERIKASVLGKYFTNDDGVYNGFTIAVRKFLLDRYETDEPVGGAVTARAYTTWLRKLGIDCVFDAGFGQIANHEPVQAFFVSGAVTKTIKTLVNSTSPSAQTKLRYAKYGKNLDFPNLHRQHSTAKLIIKDIYALSQYEHNLIDDGMTEQHLFTVFNDFFSQFSPGDEGDLEMPRIAVLQIAKHGLNSKSVDSAAMDFRDMVSRLKYLAKVFSIFKTCAAMCNKKFGDFFDLVDIQSDIIHIGQVTKFYQTADARIKSTQYLKLISIIRDAEDYAEVEEPLLDLIDFLLPDGGIKIDNLLTNLKMMVIGAKHDGVEFDLHNFNNRVVTNQNSKSLMTVLYDQLTKKYKRLK